MRTNRIAVFAAIFLVSGSLAVFGHAKMTASIPKDGETVPAGLSEIQLTFSKPLRLTLFHVRSAKDQRDMPIESALPKSFANSARVTFDVLPAGPYEVSWTAVSADGHVMKGKFVFSVGEARNAQPAQ